MGRMEWFRITLIIGLFYMFVRGILIYFDKGETDFYLSHISEKYPISNRVAGLLMIITSIIALIFTLFFYDTIKWK